MDEPVASAARADPSDRATKSTNAGTHQEGPPTAKRPQHEAPIPLSPEGRPGTAHMDPPCEPSSAKVPRPEEDAYPGADGRKRHVAAVWEFAVEVQGVGVKTILFLCKIFVGGRGYGLEEGKSLLGMFAYCLARALASAVGRGAAVGVIVGDGGSPHPGGVGVVTGEE